MLSWVVAALTPIALVGLSVRAILLPAFPMIEYQMPYFPEDPYGFSREERLHWAGRTWEYLVDDPDVPSLGELRFEDGRPIYNSRELQHMDDVKRVVEGTLRSWRSALFILIGLGAWAWLGKWGWQFGLGLARGGRLMVALAGLIGLIVGVGMTVSPDVFWDFFTIFHGLFFEGDSWLFLNSDTLIRLFPIRFWQDAFLLGALIALGGGIALAFRSPRHRAASGSDPATR
jgi:integral membrane protein (TIGR01906 family)